MEEHGKQQADSRWRRGGAVPGAPGQAAFGFRRGTADLPILIAVPHAGRNYPANLLGRMRLPEPSRLRLEDRMADLVGEAVARQTGTGLLVAHAPRALIDLNRSTDDVDWEMVAGGAPGFRSRMAAGRRARSGLGLVPRRLAGLGEIWRGRMTAADLEQRIDLVHCPYHQMLSDLLEKMRDRWGCALLIDLHSMPPLADEPDGEAGAQFVLGDRFGASCDGGLVRAALSGLSAAGVRVAHNRPYAGGYVLDRHGAPARGIHALQVEVCRSAYLDTALKSPGPGFAATVGVLAGLVRRLLAELPAAPGHLLQAAE
jgi:N-formylglutamate amidohydrolase